MARKLLTILITAEVDGGQYFEAVSVGTGETHLILPAVMRGCPVAYLDGASGKGLHPFVLYEVEADIRLRKTKAGDVLSVIWPVFAQEVPSDEADEIDWNSIPYGDEPPSLRNYWLVGSVACVNFARLGGIPPF